MINANFSEESLNLVREMLYAEGQIDPLEGTCGQRKKREAMKQPRTPAQAQADRARSQSQQGGSNVSSSVRSEAAKKAAETRKRCKGGTPGKTSTTTTT
jgi:hypothetical protein